MAGVSEDRELMSVVTKSQEGKKSSWKCHPNQLFILLLCFLINVLSASCMSTLGIYLVEFMEYFNTSKSAVTWIAGANLGVSFFVGPLLGFLLKKLGSRTVGSLSALITTSGLVLAAFINDISTLYVTFGLMAGVGPCAYYAIANSTIQLYFKKRRALASAFALTAISVGGFLWPPLIRWLIDHLCWQGSLLILACLHLQMVVAFFGIGLINDARERQISLKQGQLEKPSDNSDGINPDNKAKEEMSHVSRSIYVRPWLLLSVMYSMGVCFGMILHMSILVYTPTRGKELGIEKTKAAILVSIVNLAGGLCRIPAGFIGDLKYINRGFLLATSVSVGGILAILSRFLVTFIELAVFSAIYGAVVATFIGLQTVVLSDISGLKHLPVAMGILLAGHGASSLLLHPIAGSLLDSTGTANAIYLVTGLGGIIGSSLVVIATIITLRRKRMIKRAHTGLSTGEEICLKDA